MNPQTIVQHARDGRGDRWFLLAIALGATFAPLNSTMIAVALPRIQDALDVPVSGTAWLVTLYLVAMAAGQPVGGKLGDQLGRRRVYLLGLVWFVVASIGCALSPTLPILIIFRTQQALAGALSFPNIAAMIRESTPSHRQGTAFGLIGMASAVAAAIGPPLGGVLVDVGGWSSVFWINIPLGAVTLVLGWWFVPRKAAQHRIRAFDVAGTALLTLGLAMVIVIPTLLKTQGSPMAIATIAGAAAIGYAFIRHERHTTHPVIDMTLFRHQPFVAACSAQALGNLVMYTTLLALPMFLEDVLGMRLRTVGVILVALSACSATFGPVGGRWTDRVGKRRPAVFGGCLLLCGAIGVTIGVQTSSVIVIVCGLALSGTGLGISGASLIAAATGSVTVEQAGSASGVFSTSRYFGSILGSVVLTALLTDHASTAYAGRFPMIFAGLTVAAALTLLAMTAIEERPLSDTAQPANSPLDGRSQGHAHPLPDERRIRSG